MKDIQTLYCLLAGLALAALLGISFHLVYWAGLVVAALAYAGCVVYQFVKTDEKFAWGWFIAATIGGAFISLCFGIGLLI